MSKHTTQYRVYYEDTDAGGVVYYANYLKFAERARTDMLRDKHINQSTLLDNEGIAFVVKHVDMSLRRPGRLDYLLRVETQVSELSGPSIHMEQSIFHEDILLAYIKVHIVCVKLDGMRPVRLPESVIQKL